jgi:hypothetical protein
MADSNHPDHALSWTLIAVSFLLLTLELAQIRLFSYSLFPTVVYVAIAITLLGLGASGSVLALAPRLLLAESRAFAARATLAFAVAVPVSHLAFARLIEPGRVRSVSIALASSSPGSPCPTSSSGSSPASSPPSAGAAPLRREPLSSSPVPALSRFCLSLSG